MTNYGKLKSAEALLGRMTEDTHHMNWLSLDSQERVKSLRQAIIAKRHELETVAKDYFQDKRDSLDVPEDVISCLSDLNAIPLPRLQAIVFKVYLDDNKETIDSSYVLGWYSAVAGNKPPSNLSM